MYIAWSSTWVVSCFRSAKSFAYSAIPSHYFNAYRVTSLVPHVLSSYAACPEYARHYFVYFLFGRLSSPSRGIFNAQHVWSQPTIHHAKYLHVRVQKDKKNTKQHSQQGILSAKYQNLTPAIGKFRRHYLKYIIDWSSLIHSFVLYMYITVLSYIYWLIRSLTCI